MRKCWGRKQNNYKYLLLLVSACLCLAVSVLGGGDVHAEPQSLPSVPAADSLATDAPPVIEELPEKEVIMAADFDWHEPLAAAAVITSPFGERNDEVHHGVDLACDYGTMIRTVAAGTVIEAGWKNDVYGYFVAVDHGGGWVSRYAHCAAVAVETGEAVKRGQAIAIVGSTGNSTGAHLHLELAKDGVYVDPLLLVPAVLR